MQQDCEYDAVEIRSGLDQQQSRLHGAYCGSQPPQPVTSESNALRVTFTSDNTVQKSGFAAFFFTGRQQTSPAGTAVDFGVVRPSVASVPSICLPPVSLSVRHTSTFYRKYIANEKDRSDVQTCSDGSTAGFWRGDFFVPY